MRILLPQTVPRSQRRLYPGERPVGKAAPRHVRRGAVGLGHVPGQVGKGTGDAVAAEAVDGVEDRGGGEGGVVFGVVEGPVPEGLSAAVAAFVDEGGFIGPGGVSGGVRDGMWSVLVGGTCARGERRR
jgi:hypothetical protein